MKKITIAFDVDGTLRKNTEERHRTEIEENKRIVEMLLTFASFKNVEVHIWSNRGKEYCQMIRQELHLQNAVQLNHCHKKLWAEQQSSDDWADSVDYFKPDVAIDDQQRFDGGVLNLIVREK